MKKPTISVVMPVYNVERYLGESIKSILEQSFKDFEFIIVDDGSSDKSLEIIKKFKDNRIRVVIHQENKGFAYSVNEGYKLARGKYVARMDGDDVSHVERFSEQIKFFENNPKVAICGTWAKAMNENGDFLFNMRSPTGLVLKYNYWKPSPLIHPSVMFNRVLLGKVYLNKKYSPAEDYDLWLRLSKKVEIVNIAKFLLFYRVNKGGMSNSNFDRKVRSGWNVFNDNVGLKSLKLEDYCSLVCLSFEMDWIRRFRLLILLSKKVEYPFWFLLLDNGYYILRQVLYKIKPSLKKL